MAVERITQRRRPDRRLAYIIGAVVAAGGVAMVPAAATAAGYREWSDAAGIAGAAAVTVTAGLLAWRVWGRPGELTTREGFAAAGLAYFVLAAFGMLPYLFTGAISEVTDAYFAAAAGFTTTGSAVTDPSQLSHGILIWRATTQWLGGMGIIVLSIAILPTLGVGGVQLARAEAPGPEPDRLTPRFRETAKRLWLVYLAMTALALLLLSLGDMSPFQAVAHGLTTVSSGGFGTEPDSVAGFSAYTQWVIIGFMFATGVSFALHYRALRHPGVYLRNSEFRLYAGIVAGAAVLIVAGLWAEAGGMESIRNGVFAAVALVTTTGFVTDDFAGWVEWLQIGVVVLMFCGAMAGSTSGSIKTFRYGVLFRSSSADLKRLVYPDAILVTRFGGKPVPPQIAASIQSFFIFYMLAFVAGTVLLAISEAAFGDGTDLITATSAVASAIGNIGPGLGEVGPSGTYAGITIGGKWLLSFLMILGRLEIFPVLLLFTRHLWRR
jgi:trk system potassium uptake protein TrkH